MKKISISKIFLEKEYIINKKSCAKIAKEIGCGKNTVSRYLTKNNIKIRTISEANKGKEHRKRLDIPKDFLIEQYIINKKSTLKIAEELGVSYVTILNYLKEYKIKTRNYSEARKYREIQPALIDGKTLKKYYCKNEGCNNEIHWHTACYGEGRCIKCSNQDRGVSRFGKDNFNWKGGLSFEPYPLGWTKTFKEQIRYRDGYKCQFCGCSELENAQRLCVHHIDYDKDNLNPNNLLSLCRHCHPRTNGNRDYYYAYFMHQTGQEIGILDSRS